MIKIVKKTENDITTYQVVDEAYGDMPESRGKIASTVQEAVNYWLYPNNDESGVAKFLAEVPIVEETEESAPEPVVGEIPQGNVINMIIAKDFMRPHTHHALVGWCMSVLGYESTTDPSLSDDTPEITSRVQKIDDPMLLLRLIEVAQEGIRGCRGDKYNDAVATAIQNACMVRLGDFADSLPPSIWHKVHRHALWSEGAETDAVSLPSPDGWISISGFRESQHGGWQVRMKVSDKEYLSPQYVTGMGMKARHDGYAKGSHSGVQCHAFHLFNADGSLWGYEVYLSSPKKTAGCEVTKAGRFSLFRKDVGLPPRDRIRQGDMLLRRIAVQAEDEISVTPQDTPQEMRSVTILNRESIHDSHSSQGEIPPEEEQAKIVKLTAGAREHKHKGYDYWHPVTRAHVTETVTDTAPEERVDKSKHEYENVLVLKDDAVLSHPDHPSVALEAGYYEILPVEGETDFQPRQRGGD